VVLTSMQRDDCQQNQDTEKDDCFMKFSHHHVPFSIK
jgi:hypothetical protein